MNDLLQMLWTQAWQIAVLAIMVAFCTRTIARESPAPGSCNVAAGACEMCDTAHVGAFSGSLQSTADTDCIRREDRCFNFREM
jgi:hypothetical protein